MRRLHAAGAMSSLSSIIVLLLLTGVNISVLCYVDDSFRLGCSNESGLEVNAQMVPPRLTPKTETGYIVVQAEDTFQLQCESKSPISWTYPVYTNYESTLEISNAFYMDTGYYYCNIEGSDGDDSLSGDSTKIYVFVNDSRHLLVPGESVVLAYEHKSNEIPCRPTSPDIEVSLSNDEDLLGTWNGTSFQKNPNVTDLAQRLSFSPQVGFTLTFSAFQDEGMYECVAKRGNHDNETTYIIHVLRRFLQSNAAESVQLGVVLFASTDSVPAPTIQLITEGMKHVEEKLTFSLNCSVNVSSDVKFVLSWEAPNNIAADEGRRMNEDTISYKFTEGGREVLVGHRLLTVKKASKKDTGNYKCIIVDHNKMKNSESYYVEVYDENTTYINITEVTNDSVIEAQAEISPVHWVVYYEAHPDAIAQWTNPKGEIIVTNSAYEVTTNKTVTSLSIKNVTLDKAGKYMLELKNSMTTKQVYKKLIVNGKPYNVTISQINNENKNQEILSSTKSYMFRCHGLLHPGGVMKWRFIPCTLYGECDKERELPKPGKLTSYSVHNYSLASEINIPTNESGYLTCIATNTFDSPGGFEITEHSKLVEKYDMELNCSVSKYIYEDNIRWLKDGEEVNKKDGFVVSEIESDTKFSFRSTLKVDALRREHTGNYTCTVQKRGGSREGRSLDIKVQRLVSSKILSNSTMNNGDIYVPRTTETYNLTCFTSGTPTPQITWYKLLKAALKEMGLQTFETGATECINPDLGVEEQAELLPYDKKWEFPRDKLKLALAEDRKAREAHEESNRVNYTSLSFQGSDGCSSPGHDSCSSPPPEFGMRHGSYQEEWNTWYQERIMDGYRMEKPKYATSAIYNTMLDCWNGEPGRRPTFTELAEKLGSMLEDSVKMHYMDLNSPYLRMNQDGTQMEDYLAMMCAPTYCNEMARQKTPLHDYMNLPPVADAEDSNYLSMSANKKEDDTELPLTEEDGYLRMNVNSPTRSVLFSPQPNDGHFQYPNTNKLSPTDKNSANISELKPMLPPGQNNITQTELPQKNPPTQMFLDDDRFGDGLQSNLSPCFDNPSYRFLGQDGIEGRKRGYSEASSSGFHSERDSLGNSPKQSEEENKSSSPPPYQEATAMDNTFIV
ncbi:hypothetical protein B566_EDAN015527 [Ephemera danica]|nr:hypothetical protein B566_EDAN015527 [Ephemera danica]